MMNHLHCEHMCFTRFVIFTLEILILETWEKYKNSSILQWNMGLDYKIYDLFDSTCKIQLSSLLHP